MAQERIGGDLARPAWLESRGVKDGI